MLVMFYLLNLHYWDQSRKMGSYAQFLYIVQPRCMRQKASPYDQAMVESTAFTNLLYLRMLNSFFSLCCWLWRKNDLHHTDEIIARF